MSKHSPSVLNHILRLLLLLVVGVILLYGTFFGWLFLAFTTPHKALGMIAVPLVALGLFLGVIRLCWGGRLLGKISLVLIVLPLLCAVPYYTYRIWHETHYPPMAQQVNWWEYSPNYEGNKLVSATIPPELQITDGNYPRLNGAYALYPIYAAVAQAMYPADLTNSNQFLATNGSDVIYEQLLENDRELIFALAPSAQQQADAEAHGVTYELTPFCQDAFVFFVNARNPIDNLTVEQIRGIYAGEITDWQELGAPKSTKIIPFQRNEGSGSQTTLQKLMGDRPIMPPLEEDRLGGMGDIIHDTASYRNYHAALGFSFRFYATEMLRNNQLKLLAVDGIAPTVENIQNGTYPLVTTAYIVSAKPRSENARKIVDFLLSPTGQKLVEETGYIPVGPTTSE